MPCRQCTKYHHRWAPDVKRASFGHNWLTLYSSLHWQLGGTRAQGPQKGWKSQAELKNHVPERTCGHLQTWNESCSSLSITYTCSFELKENSKLGSSTGHRESKISGFGAGNRKTLAPEDHSRPRPRTIRCQGVSRWRQHSCSLSPMNRCWVCWWKNEHSSCTPNHLRHRGTLSILEIANSEAQSEAVICALISEINKGLFCC